jgi:hypothetical protein
MTRCAAERDQAYQPAELSRLQPGERVDPLRTCRRDDLHRDIFDDHYRRATPGYETSLRMDILRNNVTEIRRLRHLGREP